MKGKIYESIEEEFRWFRDVTEGNVFPIPEVTCKALTMELLTSSSGKEEEEGKKRRKGEKKKRERQLGELKGQLRSRDLENKKKKGNS